MPLTAMRMSSAKLFCAPLIAATQQGAQREAAGGQSLQAPPARRSHEDVGPRIEGLSHALGGKVRYARRLYIDSWPVHNPCMRAIDDICCRYLLQACRPGLSFLGVSGHSRRRGTHLMPQHLTAVSASQLAASQGRRRCAVHPRGKEAHFLLLVPFSPSHPHRGHTHQVPPIRKDSSSCWG